MTYLPAAEASKAFFVSDLHLKHRNIIRYCHMPFNDVFEMNDSLIRNWNETVKPENTVYFLGDLCFNSDPLMWLRKLNGQKVLIKGSHDKHIPTHFTKNYETMNVNGVNLYLVHNPAHVPPDWDGWVIHGHLHHHRPFIDRARRMINVSVERIDYKPISLDKILDSIGGS